MRLRSRGLVDALERRRQQGPAKRQRPPLSAFVGPALYGVASLAINAAIAAVGNEHVGVPLKLSSAIGIWLVFLLNIVVFATGTLDSLNFAGVQIYCYVSVVLLLLIFVAWVILPLKGALTLHWNSVAAYPLAGFHAVGTLSTFSSCFYLAYQEKKKRFVGTAEGKKM